MAPRRIFGSLLPCLLLIFSIQLTSSTEQTCESGRYYFGNMDSSYQDKIHLQGFYKPTVITYLGRTVYQLQSSHQPESAAPPTIYLYFYESEMNTSYWLIGCNIGEMNAEFSIESSSGYPETDRAGWYVRTSSGWVREQGLRLVCVGEKDDVCKTGTLRMSGAFETNKIAMERMGVYHLMNETHQLRPIYKHESLQNYMFYHGGLWMLGPDVHQARSSMFAPDYALRPELTLRPWVTFNGFTLTENSNIMIICEGLHELPVASEDTIMRVTSVEAVRYVNGREYPEDDIVNPEYIVTSNVFTVNQSFCDIAVCQNGGSCVEAEDGTSFWCQCDQYHFGPLCEKEVMCGAPPEVPNAYLNHVTSRAFLGLALYTCHPGYMNTGSQSVCSVDGTWHERPVCGRGNFTIPNSNSRILSVLRPPNQPMMDNLTDA